MKMKTLHSNHTREQARQQDRAASIDVKLLGTLSADAFHRVVKVCCEENCLTVELAEEFKRRLGEERLGARDLMFVLLIADGKRDEEAVLPEISVPAMLHLVRHPEDAAWMLTTVRQHDERIGAVRFDTTVSGPQHAMAFISMATIQIDGEELTSAPAMDGRKARSQQLAAVNLVAKIADLVEPFGVRAELAVIAPVTPPTPIKQQIVVGENFVGACLEYAQKRHVGHPRYRITRDEQAGGFDCIASCDGKTTLWTGATAKAAKQGAARALWDVLE